jgi:RNA polymerase sigma-70 factor (ECF subfamily)
MVSNESGDSMTENQTILREQRRRPDEELVAASKNEELLAMEELLSRYREQICCIVCRRTENIEEAEDVIQEAMLRVFVNIGTFRGDARFSSWLAAIAVDVAISMKRKHGHTLWIYIDDPNRLNDERNAWALIDPGPSSEQYLRQKERHILLLQKFRAKYRITLITLALNELSAEEAAQALRITCAAVRSRLHGAMRMLPEALCRHDFPRQGQKDRSIAMAFGR